MHTELDFMSYSPEKLKTLTKEEQIALDLSFYLRSGKQGLVNLAYKTNGYFCRGGKKSKRGLYRSFPTDDLKFLQSKIVKNADNYITVNLYNKDAVGTDRANIQWITEVYIDLDLHKDSDCTVEQAGAMLEENFLVGFLPRPTKLVMTGRGYALHYQYEEPLLMDSDEANRHRKLYQAIFNVLEQRLSFVEIDRKVSDEARVARLAGTYNVSAKQYASIISFGPTYTLNSLQESFGISKEEVESIGKKPTKTKKEKLEKEKKEKIKTDKLLYIPEDTSIPKVVQPQKYNAAYLLKCLDKLYQKRNWVEKTHRERFLFAYYNLYKMLHGAVEAYLKILELNQGMTEPLSEQAISYLMEHTDNHMEETSCHGSGFFLFRADTLVSPNWLDATQEEIETCGFFDAKNTRLAKQKQYKKNQENAYIRDEQIVYLFLCDGLGCKSIAKRVDMAPSAIRYILQRFGLSAEMRGHKEYLSQVNFIENGRYNRPKEEGTNINITIKEKAKKEKGSFSTSDAEVFYSPRVNFEEEAVITASKADIAPKKGLGYTPEILSFLAQEANILRKEAMISLSNALNEGNSIKITQVLETLQTEYPSSAIQAALYTLHRERQLLCDVSEEEIAETKALLQTNANLFITGCGGSGKTMITVEWFKALPIEEQKKICFLSMNGLAASNLPNGQTIHSFFRLPLHAIMPETIYDYSQFSQFDTIVIDEIGQLRLDIFEAVIRTIKEAERRLKKNIRLICLGDFSQIQPVLTKEDSLIYLKQYGNKLYAFQSPLWTTLNFTKKTLRVCKRQKDLSFMEELELVRFGQSGIISYLNDTLDHKEHPSATYICPTNQLVQKYNEERVFEAENKQFFPAKIEGQVDISKTNFKEIDLQLAKGMRIMTITNTKHYKNGMLGTITKINKNSILVQFDNEEGVVKIAPKIFRQKKGSIKQYPITYGYAITADKAQGLTLKAVNIHPGFFAAGQLYTALSRCPDKEHIHLLGKLTESDLFVNLNALCQCI